MPPKRAQQTLSLTNHSGNIFAAPENTVLIHACNTLGTWGAGIALPFKLTYPNAFKTYHAHCLRQTVQTGTSLLIPPQEVETAPKHWIGCLFTSAKYGRQKDSPEEILENTSEAMKDLLARIREVEGRGEVLGGLRMCRVNSGRFGVEWGRSEGILRGVVVEEGERGVVEVWEREGEDG